MKRKRMFQQRQTGRRTEGRTSGRAEEQTEKQADTSTPQLFLAGLCGTGTEFRVSVAAGGCVSLIGLLLPALLFCGTPSTLCSLSARDNPLKPHTSTYHWTFPTPLPLSFPTDRYRSAQKCSVSTMSMEVTQGFLNKYCTMCTCRT